MMAQELTIVLSGAGNVSTAAIPVRWLVVAAGVVVLVVVWRACRLLRGTTLCAPFAWAAASLAAVVADVAGTDALALATAAHVHYLAAISTLAPFVALLGAKRPQNRAWQWIVAALLLLLALQSLKSIVIDHGSPPAIHPAWRWLLAILLLAELFNYLPTRNAIAAGLAFAGQVCLLADYLPTAAWPLAQREALGLGLLAAGVLGAAISWRVRSSRRVQYEAGAVSSPVHDRAWLDFRDAYGALWALRVAERMNATGRQSGWPLRLSWRGFETMGGSQTSDGESCAAVERAFRAILARFVDADWLPS